MTDARETAGNGSKPRLLIIEDEPAISSGLTDVFLYHGYGVECVADGRTGLDRALAGDFDLILLDIMLPKMNGFDVCDAIRKANPDQPVIMLTARSSDEDIIQGLKLGADDYVAKPFSVEQLVLRVAAVLRRSLPSGDRPEVFTLADGFEIDARNLSGRRDGNAEVTFTRREMDILQLLAAHTERVISRDELLSDVWGYARHLDLETRTVDIHVAKIRRKIEADPKSPVNLTTVRGAGYRLLCR